jgi:hypothetical protein
LNLQQALAIQLDGSHGCGLAAVPRELFIADPKRPVRGSGQEAQLQNVATETAKGVDVEVFCRHESLGGDFSHWLAASCVGERDLIAFPGAEALDLWLN